MNCLWCGRESKENPFCPTGGQTLVKPKTGEQTVTKSLCYNDFLIVFKASTDNQIPYSAAEKEYLLHQEDIKAWYASIPFIQESLTTRTTTLPNRT